MWTQSFTCQTHAFRQRLDNAPTMSEEQVFCGTTLVSRYTLLNAKAWAKAVYS